MTRLSDEELDELGAIADAFLPSRGADLFGDAATELRERRAADLTSFERVVLMSIRDDIAEREHHDVNKVRVIDKLLNGGREGK